MKVTIADMKSRLDLHEVARKLGIAEWPGKCGSFSSPLRPDASESFSIYSKGSELMWKDHATGDGGDSLNLVKFVRQCSPREAIEWMRREAGFPEEVHEKREKTKRPRQLEAIYDYRAADGSLVHQTLKFRYTDDNSKTFSQRRPSRQGEKCESLEAKYDKRTGQWWLWSLRGIEPVLYNLPQITARDDEPILLVEGEKDADNAAKFGLLATTSPMGAGKWRASFTESLKGRTVQICPDRDEAGNRHAVMVAKALVEAGCRVSIVDWVKLWPDAPEGKVDFTDFISAAMVQN
jgi:hypothetical protein